MYLIMKNLVYLRFKEQVLVKKSDIFMNPEDVHFKGIFFLLLLHCMTGLYFDWKLKGSAVI